MQVPVVNQQVQQNPIQLKQMVASNASFGGNQAKAIEDIGQNFAKSIEAIGRIKEEADDTRVKSAYYDLLRKKADLVYGQDGVSTKFGKDALNIQPEFMKRFNYHAEEVTKGLTENQKIKFKALRDKEAVDFNETLNRHFLQEDRKYKLETYETGLEVHANEIINKTLSGKTHDDNINEVDELLARKAEKLGQDTQTYTLEKQKYFSKIHSSIVEAYANRDDDLTANQYYQKNKNSFLPEDQKTIEKLLKSSTFQGESKRQTENILNQYKDDPVKALEKAKKIRDAKLSDSVIERIKQEYANDKAIREDEQDQLYYVSLKAMQQSGGRSTNEMFESIPISIRERLSAKTRKVLAAQFNDPVNNDQKWLQFQTLSHKQIADMNELKFREYWAEFDAEKRTKAESIWRESKKNVLNPTESNKFKSMINDNEMLIYALAENQIGDIKKGDTMAKVSKDTSKAKAFAELQQAFNQRLGEFYSNNGRNPSFEEKDKMLKKLFVMKEGFIGSKTVPVYSIEKDDVENHYVPMQSIPPAHLQRTIQKIKELNPQLSELKDDQIIKGMQRQIERAYLQVMTNQNDELILKTLKYKK